MNWIDIAGIVFVCVTMNHLGLISAIERATHRKLWIVDCPKCCSFWLTLAYSYHFLDVRKMITVLAISFLASYSAIWLELIEGFVDKLYMKCYEKIYPDSGYDTLTAADFEDDTDGSVP